MGKKFNNISLKEIKLAKLEINNDDLHHSKNDFEQKLNIDQELITGTNDLIITTTVEIRPQENDHILGRIVVKLCFEVNNIEHIFKEDKPDQALVAYLNQIAISTTRGIMFSQFKGTTLQNVLLPLVRLDDFEYE